MDFFPFGTNKYMVIPRIPHKNGYPHILTPNIYPLVNMQTTMETTNLYG